MKNIFTKIFLFLCALAAIAEGALFFIVYLGRVPVRDVALGYKFILETPEALNTVLGFAAAFLCIGAALLLMSFRRYGNQKEILIKEKGGVLRIPLDAVRDFVTQTLELRSSMSGFETDIKNKGKWLAINISSAFNGGIPVSRTASDTRNALKEEIERVFEFNHFKINFQMRHVSLNSKKKPLGKEAMDNEQAGNQHKLLPLESSVDMDAEGLRIKEQLRKKGSMGKFWIKKRHVE